MFAEERLVCIPRGRDNPNKVVNMKLLGLYTPQRAAEDAGLVVERPVLTSGGDLVDTHLIYQKAGQIVEAPKFAPRHELGIIYDAIPLYALTNGSMLSHKLQLNSWIAVVDPIGRVYGTESSERFTDWRYVKAVRVKEIRAYCYRCLDEELMRGIPVTRTRVIDEPLSQGLAVDPFVGRLGEGILKAICGLEKHPDFANLVRFNFRIAENGEFVLSDL